MDKRDILKSILKAIQESRTGSEGTIDFSSGQGDGGTAKSGDEQADEQAVMSLSWEFAKALNDRNFERLDGRAEYYFYTLDHLIDLL